MCLFILPITANLISFSWVKIEPASTWKSRGTKTAAKKLILINRTHGREESQRQQREMRCEAFLLPASQTSAPGRYPPPAPTGQPRCWKELGRLESWELGSRKIKRMEKCDFPLVFKPTCLARSFMSPDHPTTNTCRAARSLPNPNPSHGPRFAGPACLALRIAENLCKPQYSIIYPTGLSFPSIFPIPLALLALAPFSPRSGIQLGTAETSR